MRLHARCIAAALLAGASRTYTASAHAVSPILGTEDADSQPYLPYFMPDRQICPMDMMQKCHYRKVLQGTCFTCTGSAQGIDSRGWRQGWRMVTQWPTLKPDGWNPQAPIIHLSSLWRMDENGRHASLPAWGDEPRLLCRSCDSFQSSFNRTIKFRLEYLCPPCEALMSQEMAQLSVLAWPARGCSSGCRKICHWHEDGRAWCMQICVSVSVALIDGSAEDYIWVVDDDVRLPTREISKMFQTL